MVSLHHQAYRAICRSLVRKLAHSMVIFHNLAHHHRLRLIHPTSIGVHLKYEGNDNRCWGAIVAQVVCCLLLHVYKNWIYLSRPDRMLER